MNFNNKPNHGKKQTITIIIKKTDLHIDAKCK